MNMWFSRISIIEAVARRIQVGSVHLLGGYSKTLAY